MIYKHLLTLAALRPSGRKAGRLQEVAKLRYMATSKNFFGMRRGSTKSLTFQVYRGVQVTKDRVTDVSNPQSDAQMEQRLKLPIVSEARSVLRDLVNHSWEGVAYGEESLKNFSSRNLTKGQLIIASYVPKGIMDTGVSNLWISDGSLSNRFQFTSVTRAEKEICKTSNTGWDGDALALPKVYNADDPIDAALISYIKTVLSLEDNDQLTVLLQRESDTYDWTGTDGEVTGNYHTFTVSRLIMSLEKASQWKVAEPTAENQSGISITDGYIKLSINSSDSESSIYAEYANSDYNKIIVAGCCVFSRQVDNVWRRSPARLVIAENYVDQTNDYNSVKSTYLKSGSAESSRYLNTGTEGVGITGGN